MSGFLICRQHITAYSAVTLQPSYIFLMMSQIIKLTKTIFFSCNKEISYVSDNGQVMCSMWQSSYAVS